MDFSETMWSNVKRLCAIVLLMVVGITSGTAGVNIDKLENAEFTGTELITEFGAALSAGLEKTDRFDGMTDDEIYDYILRDVTSNRRIKNSDTATSAEDFEYAETKGGMRIVRYNGVDTEVEVPAQIDGKAVIELDYQAFADNIYLEKVILPDTVLTIGNSAFINCGKLKEVEASACLLEIGHYAFQNCSMLTSIKKRESEHTIGYRYIKDGAFFNCTSLENFDFTGETFDNMHISADAFGGCTSLKAVQFSPNLKSIDDRAFMDCTSLTEIIIPGGVTDVKYAAFKNCTGLAKITLEGRERTEEDYGTFLGYEAFAGTAITEITIPSSYAGIPGNAFLDCTNLAKVTIEPRELRPNEEARKLDGGAFSGTAITEITVPGDFYCIGSYAFHNCPNLTSFTWEGSGKNTADQYMEDRVFQDSYAITEIHLPITVSEVRYWEAASMGQATVYIPSGNMVADTLREYGINVVEE